LATAFGQTDVSSAAQSASTLASTLPPLCYLNLLNPAALDARRSEGVRIVEQLNSQVTNALDKVMLSNGSTSDTTQFCPNLNFVLALQSDVNNMNIQIEQYFMCNQCQFVSIWSNLAQLYSYRKRSITEYIVVNYTDNGCQRNITIFGVGAHFGTINWLPNDTTHSFPGPAWHTSLDFWDNDRFQITWVENPAAPGTFHLTGLTQYTEGSYPLPNGGGLVTNPISRSPFANPAPGNYVLPPSNPNCPVCPPGVFPQSTPCS